MWFFEFARISYHYVRPIGLKEHISFLLDVPFVAVSYRRTVNAYRKSLLK
jgi:hypothetical protein